MTIADKVYKRGFVIRDREKNIQQSDNYGQQKSFYQIDNGLRYPKRIQYFNNNNTQNQTGSNTEKETIERVEQGNIGLTSTQDLIKQEREIIIVMYGKIVALISDFFFLDMEVL